MSCCSYDSNIENEVIIKLTALKIKDIMRNCLRDREETVIRLLFGLDDRRERTYYEVSKVFGISEGMVRQIKNKAIKKIKNAVNLK
jgi:RNA polymerase sigma factor (sigma-70 family)